MRQKMKQTMKRLFIDFVFLRVYEWILYGLFIVYSLFPVIKRFFSFSLFLLIFCFVFVSFFFVCVALYCFVLYDCMFSSSSSQYYCIVSWFISMYLDVWIKLQSVQFFVLHLSSHCFHYSDVLLISSVKYSRTHRHKHTHTHTYIYNFVY